MAFLRWRARVGHCIPNEVFVAFQQLLHVKINQSLFKKICSLRLEIDIGTGFIHWLLNYFPIFFSYRIKKVKSERWVTKKSLKTFSVFVRDFNPFVLAWKKVYTFGLPLKIWMSFLLKFPSRVIQRRCYQNSHSSQILKPSYLDLYLSEIWRP